MLNKIVNKKYFHRSAILISTIIMILLLNVFAPEYTHQIDSRKREYYPATVVDKNSYQSCSKSNCKTYNSFTVLLEDGSYNKINVTENVYYSYKVGDVVSFERHLTDPSIIKANQVALVIQLGWMVCVFMVTLRVLFNSLDKW